MFSLRKERTSLLQEDFSYIRDDIDNNPDKNVDRIFGPHGNVYRLLSTEKEVAKEMAVDLLTSDQLDKLLDKLDELKRINHPNLARIIMFGTNSKLLLIKIPAYTNSLHNEMRRHQRDKRELPLQEALGILRQVGKALEHLHTLNNGGSPTPHYNLKPSNIMFNSSKEQVIVTDFGIHCRYWKTAAISSTKESQYVAPEVDMDSGGEAYTFSSDMWSLGVIAYELLTGKLFHKESYNISDLSNLCNQRLMTLIESLLDRDPAKRPTAKQFLALLDNSCSSPSYDGVDSIWASLKQELHALREEVALLKEENRASAEERARLEKRLSDLEARFKSE